MLDAVGTVETPGRVSHSGPGHCWLCGRLLLSRTGQKRGEGSLETGLQPTREGHAEQTLSSPNWDWPCWVVTVLTLYRTHAQRLLPSVAHKQCGSESVAKALLPSLSQLGKAGGGKPARWEPSLPKAASVLSA